MYTPSILLLLASAGLIDGRSVFEARHFDSRRLHHLTHKRATHMHDVEDVLEARHLSPRADATTLAANAIQTGSFFDGTKEIGANVAAQAPSLTSQNNFINNCAGKTLTNGLQITTGSCNGITMGDIPAKTNMVSSIITFPLYGSATIESDTTFNITVQMANMVAGSFTNADATYYAAPQALSGGIVVGHTHVTVQDMGSSLNPTTALDPTKFAFFKGINDAGNGKGLLTATVTGGLPAGNYRVCTLASSSNHQPVLMPVAQRGTADDCTKFTVIGTGTVGNIAANDGSKGIAAAALAASAVAAGPGFVVTSAAAADISSSASAEASTTSKAVGKGAQASSSVASSASKASEVSTAKGGKGTKASSSAVATEASTTKGGKGTKASSSAVTNEVSTTSKIGKGGNAASSVKSSTLSTSSEVSISKAGKASSSAVTDASTTKSGKGGKAASSVGSSVASSKVTTTKAGKVTKASSSEISTSAPAVKSTTTKKIGKGNNVALSSFSFANTTFAANTKASKASSSVSIASVSAKATSASSGNTGKGNGKGNGKSVTKVFVKKVVIIETFFEFSLALGGLCPSVAKKGSKFALLEELFDDLNSAASAACGKQFTACVSFAGDGFSVEECTTQKNSCGSAASTAKAASTAAKVTGTVTCAPSVSVTGSVVSEATFTSIVSTSSSAAITAVSQALAASPVTSKAAGVKAVATPESVCSVVTDTVFVDEPTTTAPAVAAIETVSTCAIVTSTIFVDEPAPTAAAVLSDATACTSIPPATVTVQPVAANVDVAAASGTASAASTVPTASASALGGIAAPAVTDSGDATRPFLVNGNTFVNKSAAVQRSCDIQFNACANAFNSGKAVGFNLADCQTQEDSCINAGS